MIVALTGGTGFLGQHVLDALLTAGHSVKALTRRPQPQRRSVAWTAGSLEDGAALAELASGAQAVIHVAGVVSSDAAGFDRGNRQGTEAVLRAAEGAGVRAFVHVSSLAAREPTLSLYGASKRAAEDAVVASMLDWRVVRPPGIYGPGDTEMLDLFRMAARGVVLLPPRGRVSIIHAADMAQLIVAMLGGPARQLYEADDGRSGGWTHAELARAIGTAVGRKVLPVHAPARLLRLGAGLDTTVRRSRAKLTADRAAYLAHPDWTIDPAKRPPADLWAPRIATDQGLAQTAAWYRHKGWLA